jgi:serine/threonine-protein kinase ATR
VATGLVKRVQKPGTFEDWGGNFPRCSKTIVEIKPQNNAEVACGSRQSIQVFAGPSCVRHICFIPLTFRIRLFLTEHFRFVRRYSGQVRNGYVSVKPWQGAVELSEFIPPVQAALSISPLSTSQVGSKDYFPPTVPRMRAFSSRVSVMTSKARPKRIKAFAVPGTYKHSKSTSVPPKGASTSNPRPGDIGEINFLVKQEAKGDLRKDARVQDLNNVINRLMASSSDSGVSSRRRRRLHLRTFAVTCLSEDIGILEWVPDTNAMRNLLGSSYNPQTSPFCTRRRGARLANFGDPALRSNFETCQNAYFKEGNLSRATAMFEEMCIKPYPPLLYWWFVQTFHDPHAWYEARNRFTLSAAAWSAVGHVIGLGDRHSENILVDTSSGECVHVDFDW